MKAAQKLELENRISNAIRESNQPERKRELAVRTENAIRDQGSRAYVTPSGPMLTLLTELASEGDLAGIASAYIAFEQSFEKNAQFVANSIPAKLTNGYFIKYLNLDALRVVQYERKNVGWAKRAVDSLIDPETFKAVVNEIAREIIGWKGTDIKS